MMVQTFMRSKAPPFPDTAYVPGEKSPDGSSNFTVKDSGTRQQFDSGMVRDTEEGKVDWALVADGPMLRRWAEHLTKGAKKYAPRNWMLAAGQEEYNRFRASAWRHFMQAMNGDADEDHFAAVYFNLNGMAYVKEKMNGGREQGAANQ